MASNVGRRGNFGFGTIHVSSTQLALTHGDKNLTTAGTRMTELPFEPEDGSIGYVPADNEYMQRAKDVALEESKDSHPAAAVIVRDDTILGSGANGSTYHDDNECVREQLKEEGEIGSGEGYELCEGCHPKNHAEPTAIEDAHEQGKEDLEGADLYLWGHWWACEWCWDNMLDEGIDQLYLQDESEQLFNKDSDQYVFADRET